MNCVDLHGLTRRAALGVLTLPVIGRAALADDTPEPTPAERAAMAALARGFMSRYQVPGFALAIARRGRLVYNEAVGFADRETREPLTPEHRFRIASVTKPITSAAICLLIQQGALRLRDRVFGEDGVLGLDFAPPPYQPNVEDITIEQLLTHTGGGWSNDNDDPMFQRPKLNHQELIRWVIHTRPLKTLPGATYAYSNFGYCVLGRVIEKITRRPYADFVKETVLRPCEVSDMEIAGNTLADRKPREVRYFGQGQGSDPYGMNVTRMDSHGGWIARAADLVSFADHVDGFSTTPSILSRDTIRMMTTAPANSRDYAKGWQINPQGNWWHTGSLPGTTTIMVRTHSQFCWAALTNTRATHGIDGDLDSLIWQMVGKVSRWDA